MVEVGKLDDGVLYSEILEHIQGFEASQECARELIEVRYGKALDAIGHARKALATYVLLTGQPGTWATKLDDELARAEARACGKVA